ncbi:MAG: serine O-acetyltransferase [Desulfovibrionaceae bacterium]
MMRWIVYRHRFWSAICGADIPFNENIGPGLAMPHPNGVVIHSNAIIGANCTIYQQTTIGRNHRIGEPVIGNEVIIGAGAKILGSVTIGDGARIGANSVVLDDVAAGETVVGIPARPVARR